MAGNIKINANQLTDTMLKRLREYDDEAIKVMKTSAKKAVQTANREVKNHITFTQRSGDYVSHFATRKVSEGYATIEYDWYVKDPDYRLTHLLENGHKLVKKGRTIGKVKAFPHIKYGEEIGKQTFIDEIVKGLS